MESQLVSLFGVAAEMSKSLNTVYKSSFINRRHLLEYMDANNWFGGDVQTSVKEPMISKSEFEGFEALLALWLSAYRKPGYVKIELMLGHFKGIYPITCQLYHDFIMDTGKKSTDPAWKLLDYLLCEIDKEIISLSEHEWEALIKGIDKEMPLSCAKLFSEFLLTSRHKGKRITDWAYTFETRKHPGLIKDAYSFDDFSIMAYYTFNEEMWAQQGLIEKAAESRQCADLWLFTALHFTCALRLSDMKRIPAPSLTSDSETVIEMILNGNFNAHDSVALVDEMCKRLQLKPIKPSKTASHKNVPNLKLLIPESLKAPIGLILALVLAHRPEIKPGNGFIVAPCKDLSVVRSFFGENFMQALGNTYISSRRCNKSYLQGLEAACQDDSPGKPKGYMLAALARSHKGGIGKLAEITDVYLKDARFSGYTPEFIIREMFERGVLSFIPAILLEMYCGQSYKALPIRAQTLLIGDVGLTAHNIEWIAAAVDRAVIKSESAVNKILSAPADISLNIGEILQNIASGNAPSRQEEYLCLMTSSGLNCPYPERGACIGCGYEIYTKSAMRTLMKEYTRLTSLKTSAAQNDLWRYTKILEQVVLPAISEMIAVMKLYSDEQGVNDLLMIVEKGLEDVSHSL